MASYSSVDHDAFTKKSNKVSEKFRNYGKEKAESSILEAHLNTPLSAMPPHLRDMSDLIPPMAVNGPQKHFLKFWFGEKNVDKILDNRQLIYTGQLNAQCPNFDDPDATVPYINFATQKMECRAPIPTRTTKKDIDCKLYAQNGPNPFAIEKYIRSDGTAVCRVPVARGKWFCHERPADYDTNPASKVSYDAIPNNYKGEHMTLPDGTGICIPPKDVNPHAAPAQPNVNKYSMFHQLFTDRIVNVPTPKEVASSPYYTIFQKQMFNEGTVSIMRDAVKLAKNNGKQDIVNYLAAYNDPMHGVFTSTIAALNADPLPDAIHRYHRDLYFYLKKHYPKFFDGTLPNEDIMKFLGFEKEAGAI